ncbi:MAG: hypothetical protein IKP40_13190 [Clostridia bacterium]|nr:hypothetical protein [Clostridia bacterium]
MKPAIVEYKGISNEKFTAGKRYEAFFLEYWEGVRNSLHVRGNDGRVTDFHPFEDFIVIADDDNLLNSYEARIRCVTHRLDGLIGGLTYGEEYKAIGRDKAGLFLVKDDSACCYFYDPSDFIILDGPHGILAKRSVYYSYHGGDDEVRKN